MADGQTEQIRIIHAPRANREPNGDRNLRILQSVPEKERTIGHLYYLTTELARIKDPTALDYAKRFLAHPESGEAERYEVWLTLAALADDPSTKAGYYQQATAESPGRVEAWYEQTALALSFSAPGRALSIARIMQSIPTPRDKRWNHRARFYGFFRDDLYWQALRNSGQAKVSDLLRFNAHTPHTPRISLLHATRRPVEAVKARTLWLMQANDPYSVEHIFSVDEDDEGSVALAHRWPTLINRPAGCVGAWNAAAKQSSGEILVQLSDDWLPPKGWDDIIRARLDTTTPQVLRVSDGHRKDNLLCMAILTRKRYEQQGYLFHPDFTGVYADNWFTDCAEKDGIIIDASDIVIEHRHPLFTGGAADEVYRRQNSTEAYNYNAAVYDRLRKS